MGETRTELIAWINDMFQLNITKIEQLGTGAAYCQILDSIYHDIPMGRVKFDTKMEHEYLQNFKILQMNFTKHRIDKDIPVDRLIKCKFQDNLEFTQWLKRYWDSNYPGDNYDAVSRRKGAALPEGGGVSSRATSRSSATRKTARAAASPRPGAAVRSTAGANASTGSHPISAASRKTADPANSAMLSQLTQQMSEMKLTMDTIEKERDFYFGKLRGIEILVQQQLDANPETDDAPLLKEIQNILYSTEETYDPAMNDDQFIAGNEAALDSEYLDSNLAASASGIDLAEDETF